MNLDFSSEQKMLRDTAAKFFVKECPFEKVKEIEESDTGYSKELWSKMAELGWMLEMHHVVAHSLQSGFLSASLPRRESRQKLERSRLLSNAGYCILSVT